MTAYHACVRQLLEYIDGLMERLEREEAFQCFLLGLALLASWGRARTGWTRWRIPWRRGKTFWNPTPWR
jgi:hypothetical protein